ncbi:MAG: hypothetical protein JRH01_12505 [Deltaproteobacteria bacterium]|nr:hypothetical protein [Deltaproteobacteria bacterium]MBW2397066.1 hypothetical protein [Deltaproteobacteria bacterium]
MTNRSDATVQAATHDRGQGDQLDPMRGIFVSLGLGAAGWLVVAAMVLVLRALVT